MSKDIDWQNIIEEDRLRNQANQEIVANRIKREGELSLRKLEEIGALSVIESIRDQVWGCGKITIKIVSEMDHSWWLYKTDGEITRQDKDYWKSSYQPILRTDPPETTPVGGVVLGLEYSYPLFKPAYEESGPSEYAQSGPARVQAEKIDPVEIMCTWRGNNKFAIAISQIFDRHSYSYPFGRSELNHKENRGSEAAILIPETENVIAELINRALPIVKRQPKLVELVEDSIRQIKGIDRFLEDKRLANWIDLFEAGKKDLPYLDYISTFL